MGMVWNVRINATIPKGNLADLAKALDYEPEDGVLEAFAPVGLGEEVSVWLGGEQSWGFSDDGGLEIEGSYNDSAGYGLLDGWMKVLELADEGSTIVAIDEEEGTGEQTHYVVRGDEIVELESLEPIIPGVTSIEDVAKILGPDLMSKLIEHARQAELAAAPPPDTLARAIWRGERLIALGSDEGEDGYTRLADVVADLAHWANFDHVEWHTAMYDSGRTRMGDLDEWADEIASVQIRNQNGTDVDRFTVILPAPEFSTAVAVSAWWSDVVFPHTGGNGATLIEAEVVGGPGWLVGFTSTWEG